MPTGTPHAQNTFQSGSTGADGALTPTADQTIVPPESGVFNFTTITIPANVTITFGRNASNTPVTLLATGDVILAGTINVSGNAGNPNGIRGVGGAGGFHGGRGGYGVDAFAGTTGEGLGGGGGGGNLDGTTIGGGGGGGCHGREQWQQSGPALRAGRAAHGTSLLLPLVGGSGGGGGGARAGERGGAGGEGEEPSSSPVPRPSPSPAPRTYLRVVPVGHPVEVLVEAAAVREAPIDSSPQDRRGRQTRRLCGSIGAGGGTGGFGYLRAEAFNLSTYNPTPAERSSP